MNILGYSITVNIVKQPKLVFLTPPVVWTEEEINKMWIELSNLYLKCERQETVNREEGNKLWTLVNAVYPPADEKVCNEYWMGELEKLEGWDLW